MPMMNHLLLSCNANDKCYFKEEKSAEKWVTGGLKQRRHMTGMCEINMMSPVTTLPANNGD
jgi:hypothetical protein